MGVIGLWQLLEPVGKPVGNLSTLSGQTLAVDVSLWLHQSIKGTLAYRSDIRNPHLVTMFRRISKLLYYGIHPVVVFDGPDFSSLKRATLNKRKFRRDVAKEKVAKLHREVLSAYAKTALLNSIDGGKEGVNASDLLSAIPSTSSRGSKRRAADSDDDFDIFSSSGNEEEMLRSLADSADDLDDIVDLDFGSSQEDGGAAYDLTDLDTGELQFLPLDMQREILTQMRERVRREFVESREDLPDNSDEFSQYQLSRVLKKSKITQRLEKVESDLRLDYVQKAAPHMLEDYIPSSIKVYERWDGGADILIRGRPAVVEEFKPWDGTCSAPDAKTAEIEAPRSPSLLTCSNGDVQAAETEAPRSPSLLAFSAPAAKEGKLEAPRSPSLLTCSNSELPMAEADSGTALVEAKMVEQTSVSSSQTIDASISEDQQSQSNASAVQINSQNGLTMSNPPELVAETEFDGLNSRADKFENLSACVASETVSKDDSSEITIIGEILPKSRDLSAERQDEGYQNGSITITMKRHRTVSISSSEGSSDFEDVEELTPDSFLQASDALFGSMLHNTGMVPLEPVLAKAALMPELPNGGIFAPEDFASSSASKAAAALREDELLEFIADVKASGVSAMKSQVESHLADLKAAKRTEEATAAETFTEKIYHDCQELLTLLGVPFVTAPGEAEAQCAQLELVGLTSGTITEDSDIFLFGGKTVYRNLFGQSPVVRRYRDADIRSLLSLTREQLILIAMLTGCDYTDGVEGIGFVKAVEIISEFSKEPSAKAKSESRKMENSSEIDHLNILLRFREWQCASANKPNANSSRVSTEIRNRLQKMKNLKFPPSFPDGRVFDAFFRPRVDDSFRPENRFQFDQPDVEKLTSYALQYLNWPKKRTREWLAPIMKKLATKGQPRITDFTVPLLQKKAEEKPPSPSKRVQAAIRKLKSESAIESPPSTSSNAVSNGVVSSRSQIAARGVKAGAAGSPQKKAGRPAEVGQMTLQFPSVRKAASCQAVLISTKKDLLVLTTDSSTEGTSSGSCMATKMKSKQIYGKRKRSPVKRRTTKSRKVKNAAPPIIELSDDESSGCGDR